VRRVKTAVDLKARDYKEFAVFTVLMPKAVQLRKFLSITAFRTELLAACVFTTVKKLKMLWLTCG
jgi:hypothetical protein